MSAPHSYISAISTSKLKEVKIKKIEKKLNFICL